jgi:hypothetical protein
MQNKQISFKYPVPARKTVVPTDLMFEMESRTLAVHNLGGFVAWYGQAGAGKTTTAEWMRDRVNDAFEDNNPHAFKAVFYEVGKVKAGWGNEAKRALRSLYNAVTGMLLDEGVYGRNTAEELADLIVQSAKRRRVQLAFVDEAGLLSIDAVSGLVLVADKAKQAGWLLNIVLIGMDDLPEKLSEKKRPQIFRRVHDWCYFREYDVDQTADLLRELHPHFMALDLDSITDWEQIKFVHEISGGLSGFIVQFLSRFDAQYQTASEVINTRFLRAVNLRTVYDRRDIVAQAKRNGAALPQPVLTNGSVPAKSNGKGKNNAGN